MPSMPFIEPKTASISGVLSASANAPTREALIAQVGPPDCAIAIFITVLPFRYLKLILL